jgi:phosphoglucan,water dikinase
LVECQSLQPGSLGDPLTSGPVVALAWTADGDEEVRAAGAHVKGVVLARDLPHLSHLAIRARQEKTPLAATEDAAAHAAARALLGREVILEVTPDGATLRAATAADAAVAETASPTRGDANAAATPAPTPSPATLSNKLECHPLERATTETAGAKAATCADLQLVAARSDSLFKTPPGVFVPFGVMETVCENAGLGDALREAAKATGTAAASGDPEAVERACEAARALIRGVDFPSDLAAQIAAAFPGAGATRVVVRSSANVEDLAGMSAAGLYESEIGVSTSSAAELGAAVREVWASLFSRRAVLARHIAGVPPEQAKMAVFVQEMAPAELSFVLHTRSTKAQEKDVSLDAEGTNAAAAASTVSVSPTLEAEIAVGLGETLASGAQGSPWRVEVCQQTGAVSLSSFASIGTALMLRPAVAHLGVRSETVDYSTQPLSVDVAARNALGARLAAIGAVLEAEYQTPQDVEGTVVGEQVYIVQTRPQPL